MEQLTELPEHLKVNGNGLPVKLFLLRHPVVPARGSQAGTGYRFYTLYEAGAGPTCCVWHGIGSPPTKARPAWTA
jgi:hypothetical protein